MSARAIHTGCSAPRYTESSAPGLTHDSGAATSTAPARHTRHARRVTPQARVSYPPTTPGLRHVGALKPDESHLWLPRHMELPHAYIARTTWGAVGLSREERERHVYIVGKSGSGKSTTLFNLAMHDIVDRGRRRRHRPARRPGRGGRGLHPARPHPRGLLSRRRRCRASGRIQSAGEYCARAPCARRLRHRLRLQAPVARQLGTAAGAFPIPRHHGAAGRAARHAHRLAAPLYRRAIPRAHRRARARSDHGAVLDGGVPAVRRAIPRRSGRPHSQQSRASLPPRRRCAPSSASTRRNSTSPTRWSTAAFSSPTSPKAG